MAYRDVNPEEERDASPRAVRSERQGEGVAVALNLRATVGPDPDQLLDAGRGQERVPEELAAEPAHQILREEDQFLVEGNPVLMTRGQVTTGEDSLPPFYPRVQWFNYK